MPVSRRLLTNPGSLRTATRTWRNEVPGICGYALFNAAKFVCSWDPKFAAYLVKKQAEGKHHNVAISHAAKKLVRFLGLTSNR
jgi:hypothetical protein